MPNWCCTRYVAVGNRKELEKLANTLNTMDNKPNGFGRYWMGNLGYALGKGKSVVESVDYRGTFTPDFYAALCFCGPCVDENEEFHVDEDGALRFSTISAWERSRDIEELIMNNFPSVWFAWSSWDEFFNYCYTYNPEGLNDLPIFAFNENEYSKSELREMIEDIEEYIELPPNISLPFFYTKNFQDLIVKYNREPSNDREISFNIFENANNCIRIE